MARRFPVGSGRIDGDVDRLGTRDDAAQTLLDGSRSHVDTEFWFRHLNLGLLLYTVSILVSVAYLLLVPGPNRGALSVLVGVALASVVLVLALPRRAIAASPRRLVFFYTWTAVSIVFVVVVAALDGGAESPLALLLFFTLVYSGLAYPPPAVAVVTAGATSGYLALTAVDASGRGFPLMNVVVLIGVGAVAAFAAEARERVHDALDVLATRDGLTGCLTYRAFHDRLSAEASRAERHHRPLAIVLVDLDHFKQVNDGLGHLAGDELLRIVGAVLRDGLRVGDAAGRLGGDEFALLLPETTLDGAVTLAGRRLDELAAHDISATFGVAQTCVSPGPRTEMCGADPSWMITAADRALYRAKELGRQRVEGHVCGCTVDELQSTG